MKTSVATVIAALLATGAWAQTTVDMGQTDNVEIPDYVAGNPAPVTEAITLNSSGIANITSVTVTLDIGAGDGGTPYNGDYYVYLQHGSDISILLNRVGVTDAANPSDNGYSDEGFDIILSDSGSDIHNYQNTSYSLNGAGQLTGTWAPDGRDSNPQSVQETDPRNNLLDVFDGSAADGTWTLLVEDESAGDYGVLDGWSLDVTGTTAVPEPTVATLLAVSCLALLLRRVRTRESD